MSYEYWVHQQLEPTDVIITGTYRRYDRVHTVKQMKPMVQLTEAEDNKIQDAYLEWAQREKQTKL